LDRAPPWVNQAKKHLPLYLSPNQKSKNQKFKPASGEPIMAGAVGRGSFTKPARRKLFRNLFAVHASYPLEAKYLVPEEKETIMKNKFDEMTKSVAQSVTRRQALKRFGFGLTAMLLTGFGLSSQAASHCIHPGFPCGKPGLGGCGSCCNKSFFCEISADTGRECFCN
jgi:hypothetical protein